MGVGSDARAAVCGALRASLGVAHAGAAPDRPASVLDRFRSLDPRIATACTMYVAVEFQLLRQFCRIYVVSVAPYWREMPIILCDSAEQFAFAQPAMALQPM